MEVPEKKAHPDRTPPVLDLGDGLEAAGAGEAEAWPEAGPLRPRQRFDAARLFTGAARFLRDAPQTAVTRAADPYAAVDAAVRDRLVNELHDYPRKRPLVARLLWLTTGFLGGHRYYMGHVGLGLLQTMTVGGLLIWWLVDGIILRDTVARFNSEQAKRERAGTPPLGMDFVPRVAPDVFGRLPAWYQARRRSGLRKAMSFAADALVVMFCAYVLGAMAAETNTLSAVWAIGAVVFMINFADRLLPLHHWPVANEMIRWDYKLRLYYHFNAPGRFYTVFVRPVTALCYAPFSNKCRAEVKLYLEIGGIFVAGSILVSVLSGDLWPALVAFDLEGVLSNWVKGSILGFIMVYAFAMPIGATLMRHVLLRRPNYVRWLLSALTLYFLFAGVGSG